MTADRYAEYVESSRETFAKGGVKIHVTYGEVGSIGGEWLWAWPTDKPDVFTIDNVPFFTSEPTYGDQVRGVADPTGQARRFEFVEVVERGPWTWFGVPVADKTSPLGDFPTGEQIVIDYLRAAFPSGEEMKIETTGSGFVVGVCTTVASDQVLKLLAELEAKGLAIETYFGDRA